jgi:general secretion pathway protein N
MAEGQMTRTGIMLAVVLAATALASPAHLVAATDQTATPDMRAVPRPPVFDLDARPTRVASAEVQSGNPLWAVPLSALTATRERPIFSSSRRPPPPPAAARPVVQVRTPPPRAAEPQQPRMSLVGTVAGADGIAVFVDQTTQTVVRLRAGEGHQGWVLRAIGAREVTLQNDSNTAILALPSVQTK